MSVVVGHGYIHKIPCPYLFPAYEGGYINDLRGLAVELPGQFFALRGSRGVGKNLLVLRFFDGEDHVVHGASCL